METELLIIGQGICGTFFSLELERAGINHLVIDDRRAFSASRSAAGLINPVTGRRIVTTWMIDELLPFARQAFGRLEQALGASFFEAISVTDFFPTAQMRLAFLSRLEEGAPWLHLPTNEHAWDNYFHVELGYGMISPCYLVDMPGLLEAARKRMLGRGVLREERFRLQDLVVNDEGVRYGDITARRVVFCDGIESFANPWFTRLPFAPNKGEALIVEIEGLKEQERAVFKKGFSIVPWGKDLFWVGSSYQWEFGDGEPTVAFRQRTEAALREWVKGPFRTLDHLASVRPATLERRPFVGFHPLQANVGILNGMGTKGCSLAPFFSHQLVQYIAEGKPILAEVDIRRFSKVLGRTGSG